MKLLDYGENVLIAIGLTFGISQMESVIGIIVLVCQLLLILLKYVPLFYTKVKVLISKLKNGDVKGIEDVCNDLKEDVENLVDEVKDVNK